MKIKIALILGLTCVLAICYGKPADDYEYEDTVAAAPPKPAVRNPLLNRRNHLNRATAPKSTSTTAAPVPAEEDEVQEDELIEDEIQPETSSTTESGRRLKSGVIRPFRSNQDLLEILKKRREQAIINKAHAKTITAESQESESVPSEPEKSFSKTRPSAGRGRYNKKENTVISEEEPSSTASTRNTGRRFRN